MYVRRKLLRSGSAEGVRVSEEDGEKFIPADSVVLSVGYVPTKEFSAEAENVTVIGDAEKVGNLLTVIRAAYAAAYAI